MDFRDNDALMDRIRQDMIDVTKASAEWMATKVQESVWENVYEGWEWDADHPRTYERTYQFVNSWYPEKGIGNKNESIYFIESNPSRMIWNPIMYQHGSNATDRTEEMDENIQEGKYYDFRGGSDPSKPNANLARDYWSDVVEYIDQDVLDIKFAQGLTKLGLKFIAS